MIALAWLLLVAAAVCGVHVAFAGVFDGVALLGVILLGFAFAARRRAVER